MLTFANPAAFGFLLAIPVLVALRRLGILRGVALPLTLSDWGGKSFRWERRLSAVALAAARFLGLLAFALTVGALADPAISRQEKVYTSRGAEIIFVIDVSPSMAALDMGGLTRLEAAKQCIRFLVRQQEGMACGLTAVASEAALVTPPTLDAGAFEAQLDGLVMGELGEGTALGTGLAVAVYHLSASVSPQKCIVLVTDGENNAGAIHPDTAAQLARDQGIAVYVLGLGGKGSAPISYSDPVTGKVYAGFLDSQFDEDALRHIAAQGGGRYFSASSLEELEAALGSIAGREYVAQTWYFRRNDRRLYSALILAAGIAVIVAWLIRRVYLREIV
jgi:Ca-activated chloride channel family protein